MMTYLSDDIDSIGFRRSELLAFLAQDGVNLSGLATATQMASKPVPTWASARRGLRKIKLHEAANVLIGLDPLDNEWHGDDTYRELEGAKRVLLGAVDAKELSVAEIDFGNNAVEVFNANEVRAWALAAGYDWPIPLMPTISVSGLERIAQADGGEVLKRLQDSERERSEQRAEVDRLKAEIQRTSDQSAKLAEQAMLIGQLQADHDAAKTEIQRLQTEMAQGKSLAALQKLVVGMALDSYSYDPNAAKSPVPKQIADDLARHGINIDPDTVRKHLRQAATLHAGGLVGL